MSFAIAILLLLLAAIVVLVVSAPVRSASRSRAGGSGDRPTDGGEQPAPDPLAERDELESAREAKYREIRDTELDYRTGKLSREDYQAVDGELRAEALEILNRLEGHDAGARQASEVQQASDAQQAHAEDPAARDSAAQDPDAPSAGGEG